MPALLFRGSIALSSSFCAPAAAHLSSISVHVIDIHYGVYLLRLGTVLEAIYNHNASLIFRGSMWVYC